MIRSSGPFAGRWRLLATPAVRLVLLALGVAALALLAARTGPGETLRERFFDLALAGAPAVAAMDMPVFVAIDRQSVAEHGPWPWPRDRLAELVAMIAAAKPRAIAIDILLEGPDQTSPAALARQLAAYMPGSDLQGLAADLPDGDAALARAMGVVPTVLGLALDPTRPRPMPPLAPMLARPPIALERIWQAQGVVAPDPPLVLAARGLGVLSLAGDGDATVRRAPLLVRAGDVLAPGLALDLLRVARGGAPVLIDGPNARIRLPGGDIPFDDTAMLRLAPLAVDRAVQSTVSAAALLAGQPEVARQLEGAVVILGAAAPELGGLRPGPSGQLVPASRLQAMAFAQLDGGIWPGRPSWARWLEPLAAGLGGLLAALLALRLAPLAGAASTGLLAAIWVACAFGLAALRHALLDPVAPTLALLVTFALSAIWVATSARRQAARIRTAFEQHLAPDVVHRIAGMPGSLRLEGERREVTALFSDIEGFTAMTERADPEALIALLDRYFDGIAGIVVAHGGMIDKIVGDAIHAFFNMPLDRPGHRQAAFDCALEMTAFAQRFSTDGDARALGLGRTRIGIETGPVIAGNVGGARKLDYTAHGPAVNAAARLEAANKTLGTTVLIGPGTATGVAPDALMPLGPVAIRGFAMPLRLCTPWPEGMAPATRAAWHQAVEAQDSAALADLARRSAEIPQLAMIAAALR